MDNNNYLFKSNPSDFQPAQNPVNPSKTTRLMSWIITHKKLSISILILFLAICILLLFSKFLVTHFFPSSNNSAVNTGSTQTQPQLSSSIKLSSPKTRSTLGETIPISIIAGSGGAAVTGFDAVIEYDPQYITISKKSEPPLKDFLYYEQTSDTLINISAVRKPDVNTVQIFNNTALFNLEFTSKKKGKTILKVIFMPNSISDSNIINGDSKDILGTARGIELVIN